MKYSQTQDAVKGYRRTQSERQITSTLDTTKVSVPRACLQNSSGNISELHFKALGSYQHRTKRVDHMGVRRDEQRVPLAITSHGGDHRSLATSFLRIWMPVV